MDYDSTTKFIQALAQFLQSLCNGFVDFDNWVQINGHLILSVDSGETKEFVVNERLCKNLSNSITFLSNSYHAPLHMPAGLGHLSNDNSKPGKQDSSSQKDGSRVNIASKIDNNSNVDDNSKMGIDKKVDDHKGNKDSKDDSDSKMNRDNSIDNNDSQKKSDRIKAAKTALHSAFSNNRSRKQRQPQRLLQGGDLVNRDKKEIDLSKSFSNEGMTSNSESTDDDTNQSKATKHSEDNSISSPPVVVDLSMAKAEQQGSPSGSHRTPTKGSVDDEDTDDADEGEVQSQPAGKSASNTSPDETAPVASNATKADLVSAEPSDDTKCMLRDYELANQQAANIAGLVGLAGMAFPGLQPGVLSPNLFNNAFSSPTPMPFPLAQQFVSPPLPYAPPPMCAVDLDQVPMDTNISPFTRPQPKPFADKMIADKMKVKLPFSGKAESKRLGKRRSSRKPYNSHAQRQNQIQSAKISTSTSKSRSSSSDLRSSPDLELDLVKVEPEEFMDETTDYTQSKSRHNEPLSAHAVSIMSDWFYDNVESPYPNKLEMEKMARGGNIRIKQVKSWFANKRNRTNNTKPKVQVRAMEEKLLEVCHDVKHTLGQDQGSILQKLSDVIHMSKHTNDQT